MPPTSLNEPACFSDDPVAVEIIWPSGKVTISKNIQPNQLLKFKESEAKGSGEKSDELVKVVFTEIPAPDWKHEENEFIDFHRDRLLWHMNSMDGPRASVGDINGDEIDDVFVGSAKQGTAVLFSGKDFSILQEFIDDSEKNVEVSIPFLFCFWMITKMIKNSISFS